MKRVGAVLATLAAAIVGLAPAAHASYIEVLPGGGPHVRTFSAAGTEWTRIPYKS